MIKKVVLLVFLIFTLGFVLAQSDFEMHTNEVSVSLRAGGHTQQPVSFFNSGEGREFYAEKVNNGDFYSLASSSTFVESGSYGSFELVLGSQSLSPGMYVDELIVSDSITQKKIPVIAVVESLGPLLFDSAVEVRKDVPIVPGGDLEAKVTIYNLGAQQNSVYVVYSLYNLAGDKILEQEETLDVANPVELTKTFGLPTNIAEGPYIFSVLTKGGSIAYSMEQFSVDSTVPLSPPIQTRDYSKQIFFGIILFLMVSIIALSYYWNKRTINQGKQWRTHLSRIKAAPSFDSHDTLRRLIGQKNALQMAYRGNHIRKESYSRGIIAINREITDIKKRL